MKKMRDLADKQTAKIYSTSWKSREIATAIKNPLIVETRDILVGYAIYEADSEWLQPWFTCDQDKFLRFCALGALALDEEAACIALSKVYLSAAAKRQEISKKLADFRGKLAQPQEKLMARHV